MCGLAIRHLSKLLNTINCSLYSYLDILKVATGGADNILQKPFGTKLKALHEAIASLAAQPKADNSDEEHLFANFHSSRTIRKLILDSPPFATCLWKLVLEGRCETWALGHRYN